MKKLRLGLLLILITAFFTACGDFSDYWQSPIISDDSPSTEASASTEPTNKPPIPIVVEDDSLPPADNMVRSRLTNEWINEEIGNTRPLAVLIPNEKDALPHYNLSEASILYEAVVEGRMTRMMAIYEDWENLEKIGNIRSLRSYFAYWSFEWDAFIVHIGGPFFIDDLIAQPGTENINELDSADQNAFFRSNDRESPHNAYTSGKLLLNRIREKGYDLEYRDMADENHFQFASKAEPNTLTQYSDAQNATYIDMSGCYPLTRCYFEFNEQDGLYYRSQHLSGDIDGPHIDAATGEQLTFKNIIVQNVYSADLGLEEGYLAFQCHDDTRDGWYFTNGKGIHVTWEKSSDYGATRFYDDDGNEIVLNTGKTMICVVEEGDSFVFQ